MFKAIVAGALALGALCGTAQAASPVYNWSGLYIGGFAGGVGGRITEDFTGGGPSGIDSGVTVGYAWQAHGDWVFEPFVAVPITGQTGSYASGDYVARIDWAVLAGLKIGVARERWLPYAFVAAVSAGASVTSSGTTEKNTHTGISFGLGADYALTDRWTIGGRWAHVAVAPKHYFFDDFGWRGNSFAATINYKLK